MRHDVPRPHCRAQPVTAHWPSTGCSVVRPATGSGALQQTSPCPPPGHGPSPWSTPQRPGTPRPPRAPQVNRAPDGSSSVSNRHGATAFTRTPHSTHSSARARVRPTTPPVLAQYAGVSRSPTSPLTDARLMMLPRRASTARPTACNTGSPFQVHIQPAIAVHIGQILGSAPPRQVSALDKRIDATKHIEGPADQCFRQVNPSPRPRR